MTPYGEAILKLENIRARVLEAADNDAWDGVDDIVGQLRTYKDCPFCRGFRLSLERDFSGVCGQCPCHKVGEESLGRQRAYNGCYVRAPYREMVRRAWWFRENRDRAAAIALAEAVRLTIEDMRAHEVVLDIPAPRLQRQ